MKRFRALAAAAIAAATIIGAGALTSLASADTPPFTQCPPVGADTTGCGLLLVINSDGSVTGFDSGEGPYDSIEDTLIGVQNNSAVTISSLNLTGTVAFGEGVFDFDSDGICAPPYDTQLPACPYGPTGYEGPNTSFTNIDTSNYPTETGTVNFLAGGVAPGNSAYFSLEGAITASSIDATVGNSLACQVEAAHGVQPAANVCTVTAVNGLHRVLVRDTKTKVLEQKTAISCNPLVHVMRIRINDDGHSHSVAVQDCTKSTQRYVVSPTGVVTS